MSIRIRSAPPLLLLALGLPGWADEPSEGIKEIAELSKTGKLFDKENYKAVRAACTKVFVEKHKDQIQAAYSEDFDAFDAWLDKNVAIKEEFYTAIDEKLDNIPGVLKLFKDLWKKYPEQVQKYYNLAIATAVVWDQLRGLSTIDNTRFARTAACRNRIPRSMQSIPSSS